MSLVVKAVLQLNMPHSCGTLFDRQKGDTNPTINFGLHGRGLSEEQPSPPSPLPLHLGRYP